MFKTLTGYSNYILTIDVRGEGKISIQRSAIAVVRGQKEDEGREGEEEGEG